jgi:hypothetical protein
MQGAVKAPTSTSLSDRDAQNITSTALSVRFAL